MPKKYKKERKEKPDNFFLVKDCLMGTYIARADSKQSEEYRSQETLPMKLKYPESKRSKTEIIPYTKKEREVRCGKVSTRGQKSLALQKGRKGICKAHSLKTERET